MEVTDNRRKVTVGIFIFIGLVIFVLGVFTLGSQRKAFIKSFNINVVFDDIEGLKPGANIWFSGVKIGTIKKIQFYGTSQVLVTMNVEEDARKYIHKDAAATIGSDGLIGSKIIILDGGTVSLPIIQNGDRVKVKTTVSTDEIMKTLQVNNKNLVGITEDFKTLSGNLVSGKGTAGALLSDEEIATNFRKIVSNLKATTQSADRMASELRVFSRTLNSKEGLTNKLLTDTILFSKLQASVVEFQEAAKSASAMTENLNTASSKLNQSDNAAGLLLNDKETAEQVRQTMKNLEGSSQKLDENMKALQSNFLFRGYFRRKAKEEAKEADVKE